MPHSRPWLSPPRTTVPKTAARASTHSTAFESIALDLLVDRTAHNCDTSVLNMMLAGIKRKRISGRYSVYVLVAIDASTEKLRYYHGPRNTPTRIFCRSCLRKILFLVTTNMLFNSHAGDFNHQHTRFSNPQQTLQFVGSSRGCEQGCLRPHARTWGGCSATVGR